MKLVIFDGNSILYRVFFVFFELIILNNILINVIYGFVNVILKYLE